MTTSTESIYDRLIERIINRSLPNNSRLIEQELATEFQVSRSPIRAVLNQLASDGLVTQSRNRGSVVHYLDADDIEEVFVLRITLECLALRKATARLNLEELRRYGMEFDKQRTFWQKGSLDITDFAETDWRFHRFLIRSSNMMRLVQMQESLMRLIRSFSRFGFRSPRRCDEVFAEHHSLIDALLNRDVERAVTLLEEHLASGQRAVLHEITH